MYPQNLLPSCLPSLCEELRLQTDKHRCQIIRANHNTQFAQASSELAVFRRMTTDVLESMDDDSLSDLFRKTVQLTTYDSYAPFIAKFFEKPCRASAIVDLLAPGLPDFLATSSSTSGGLPKTIPKYDRLSRIRSSDSGFAALSNPLRKRTTAFVWYLGCDLMHVQDEDDCPSKTIYLTFGSGLNRRMDLCLDPERDEERMGTFVLDHAAPYATGFIKKWKPFLLMHALFAISSRSLETITLVFISTFVDMMRHLDVAFDMIVDCIENGTIPDLDGMEEVRRYLEPNLAPDPERAAEVRNLGRPCSRPGWCSQVWPNLRSVTATASGSFASSLPLAQRYLGSRIEIRAGGYGCTESSVIGSPYNPLEPNQFKPFSRNIIEFLDMSMNDESISALRQLWEVKVGARYEVVLTTPEGLWRYRLGDVVDIAGFDPIDGVPIVQFVERRNATIRFACVMVTESELRAAMSSIPRNMLCKVVDWTAIVDDRRVPNTIGFFVELAGEQVSDIGHGIPDHISEALSRLNENVADDFQCERLGKPTVRLVRSGTFSEFRQLRLDEGGDNVGQVKVPVVLPKAAYVAWFSNRVVREL